MCGALNSTESAINNTGKQKQWTEHDESLYFLFTYVLTPLTFSFDLKRSGRVRRCCIKAPSYVYTVSDCNFFLDTRHRGRAWLYRDTDHLLTHIASSNASSNPDCLILTQYTLGKRITFRESFSKLYISTAKHYLRLETCTGTFKQFNLNKGKWIYIYTHMHVRARAHTQNMSLCIKKISMEWIRINISLLKLIIHLLRKWKYTHKS